MKGNPVLPRNIPSMPPLLLFDVDGTLVWSSAGRRAFRAAFLRCYGVPDADGRIDFAGAIDAHLFHQGLEVCGRTGDSPERVYAAYLECLAEELARDPGRVLPGVPGLLEACRGSEGWALALGTGNLRGGAVAKLAAHGLDGYFPVGGFGDDGPDRAAVLRAGIQRAREHYGRDLGPVVVVGDTPHDILAARRVGARVVAVATGRPDADHLRSCEPDQLLLDFSDLQASLIAFRAVLLNTP